MKLSAHELICQVSSRTESFTPFFFPIPLIFLKLLLVYHETKQPCLSIQSNIRTRNSTKYSFLPCLKTFSIVQSKCHTNFTVRTHQNVIMIFVQGATFSKDKDTTSTTPIGNKLQHRINICPLQYNFIKGNTQNLLGSCYNRKTIFAIHQIQGRITV